MRTQQRVLQVGPLKPSLAEILEADYGAAVLPPAGPERDAFLAADAAEVGAIVTSGRTGVDAALMADLPGLGAVINFGVGYDTTDVGEACERGVLVSNTPDVLTDCVADTALGLSLDVLRGLSAADRFVRSGEWARGGAFPLQHRLSGRRVGILGLGRIGRAIADRFVAFGCPVSYYSRREVPGVEHTYARSVVELAEAVDVLVVAVAGGPSTAGLVSGEVLTALGPTGVLVNISRGSVVDEAAMTRMLVDGRLGGAGLDVFADEPRVPEPLLALDTVVLLPHLGSGTIETRAAMEAKVLANLDEYLEHGRVLDPVPEVLR